LVAEFALRKTLEQAEKYSWERIKHVYSKLLEADLAIKTGKYGDEKYGDELALNVLVAELCQ
jgi:DNA polymerase-3 subunit delta